MGNDNGFLRGQWMDGWVVEKYARFSFLLILLLNLLNKILTQQKKHLLDGWMAAWKDGEIDGRTD